MLFPYQHQNNLNNNVLSKVSISDESLRLLLEFFCMVYVIKVCLSVLRLGEMCTVNLLAIRAIL